MDATTIAQYLTDGQEFERVEVAVDPGPPDNLFFFHGPDRTLPFVTIVASDKYDRASDLSREGLFRLNVGIAPATYRVMFGPPPKMPRWPPEGTGIVDAPYDFTTLDRVMPHPVYAPQHWICVLNPSDATFETVRPLLAEAYQLAVRRSSRRETP